MTEEKKAPADEIEYIPEAGAGSGGLDKPAAPEAEKKDLPEKPPHDKPHPDKEPAQDHTKHLKDRLKKRDAEVKHLKKEFEEFKDQYLRKLADMENLRKRLEREKSEYLQFALSDILLEFLAVLDNFERALQSTGQDADGKTLRDGIELVYRMTKNLLLKQGVQPIEIKDRKFDPNLHHALAMEESEDVEEPEVIEELQKGYLLHNRLLRPSLVRVVMPKKGS